MFFKKIILFFFLDTKIKLSSFRNPPQNQNVDFIMSKICSDDDFPQALSQSPYTLYIYQHNCDILTEGIHTSMTCAIKKVNQATFDLS